MPLVSGAIAAPVLAVGPSSVVPIGPIVPGFLVVDELGLLVGTTVVLLTILLILCSPASRQAIGYTALAIFFVFIALGTIAAANVALFYVGWELTTLLAWGLGRLADDAVDEGAVPFNAAGALASLLMFFGLLLLATASQTMSLSGLKLADAGLLDLVVLVAIFLKVFGLISEGWGRWNAGHFSLANATLLGASLLVVGLYPVLRFFGYAAAWNVEWQGPVAALAAALAILAGLAALGQEDLWRVLAYGAFSQFSALVFALAAGTRGATLGVLYGVVTYTLAVTGLVLCASLVETATGQRELRRLGGLGQRLPGLAVLFILSALALACLPPFGGFVAWTLVGKALWGAGRTGEALLWGAIDLLTVLYLARLFGRVFLGEQRAVVNVRLPGVVLAAVALLLVGSALAGVVPAQVMAYVQPAATLLVP